MKVEKRLEYLRNKIISESISYGEISELQFLAKHIKPNDTLLLEWAGVQEGKKPRRGNSLILKIDFDGTCTTHEYPDIGRNIGAIPVLQDIVDSGHRLILCTMRSGQLLQDAVNWLEENDVTLWAVNENPEQKKWTDSPKIYANYTIDDNAIGCPLITEGIPFTRPYVDWEKIREMLIEKGIII